jgi:putative FmdB family regulatory protein
MTNMPTYEYRCGKCESLTILSRSVDERDEPVTCVCGFSSNKNIQRSRYSVQGYWLLQDWRINDNLQLEYRRCEQPNQGTSL